MISGNDSAGRYKIADALRSWQPVPPRRTVVLDIYTVVLTQNTCAIECWHSDSWIDHQSMVTLRGIRIRSSVALSCSYVRRGSLFIAQRNGGINSCCAIGWYEGCYKSDQPQQDRNGEKRCRIRGRDTEEKSLHQVG